MPLLDHLAEQRIAQAAAEGAFDNLPGQGRPLDLDDDALIPEELRAAYRVLKNAGYVPPEVEARRELATLAALLAGATDEPTRARASARLALLATRLEADGRRLVIDGAYVEKIDQRLGSR